MKLKVISTSGTAGKEVDLPVQFHEEIREDLIKKAVLAIQSNRRQPYSSKIGAGNRHVSWVSKRRRDWKGSYGKGISRMPRKVLSRRGTQFNWVGAMVPGAVGGRRAHPPKVEKVWDWKLNTKEKRKAIRSAMSATIHKNLVEKRGHIIPATYPFILDESFEKISKSSELLKALHTLGFDKELERATVTKARTGKAALRGRATKVKKSLLFVVVNTQEISKAAQNLPGVDVISINKLNTEALAPGAHYGRATLFSALAVEELRKGLFTQNYQGKNTQPHKEITPKAEPKVAAAKPKPVKKAPAKKQ